MKIGVFHEKSISLYFPGVLIYNNTNYHSVVVHYGSCMTYLLLNVFNLESKWYSGNGVLLVFAVLFNVAKNL